MLNRETPPTAPVATGAPPTDDQPSAEARRARFRELGRRGGLALARKRGREWLQRIGQRGGEKTSDVYPYEIRRVWGGDGKRKRDRPEPAG